MPRLSSYLKILFKKWIDPDRKMLIILLGFIVLSFIFSAIFVYQTGGTKYSYSHIVYIPLVLSALVFKLKGGIVAGLVAGFILGPLMPINTSAGAMQEFIN